MSPTYISQLFPKKPYQVGIAHGLGVYNVTAQSFDEALIHYFLMEFSSHRNFQREELSLGAQEWSIPPSAWEQLLAYGRRYDWTLIDFVEDVDFWGKMNQCYPMPTHITVCTQEGIQECIPSEEWLTAWVTLWECYQWNIEDLARACAPLSVEDLDTLTRAVAQNDFKIFLPVTDLKTYLTHYQVPPTFQEVGFF